MNKTYKKLWVEALRSDKYKQGRNRLRRDNKFCCLGVLCDVFRKRQKKKVIRWEGNRFWDKDSREVYNLSEELLIITGLHRNIEGELIEFNCRLY